MPKDEVKGFRPLFGDVMAGVRPETTRLTIFLQKDNHFDLVWEGTRGAIPRCGEHIQLQDGRVFKVISIMHRIYTDAIDMVVGP